MNFSFKVLELASVIFVLVIGANGPSDLIGWVNQLLHAGRAVINCVGRITALRVPCLGPGGILLFLVLGLANIPCWQELLVLPATGQSLGGFERFLIILALFSTRIAEWQNNQKNQLEKGGYPEQDPK